MAASDIRRLRLKARELGVSNFRGMSERELRDAIAEANGSKGKAAGRRAVKKAAVKKAPAKRGRPAKASAKAAPAPRRGRPPKAKPAPASKAKRQSAAPRNTSSRRQTQRVEEPTGRHTLNGVNYKIESDDWNPREGSLTYLIWRQLRKFNGNRAKVYDALVGDVKEIFGTTKRTGSKWLKGERERMLEYRISRTAWDYAVKTGQHDPAEDRVEYGTGGTGQGIFKPAKKTATKRAASKPAKAAPAKRGRPAGSKAAKPAQRRTAAQKGTRKRTAGRRR